MTVTDKFTMTRIEILAVLRQAANHDEEPHESSVFQLRKLLGL